MNGILCLTPMRNVEADLPAFFNGLEAVADGLIALDDGSTDASRRSMAAHPLTLHVLSNPVREGYAGWDDLANRRRLLEAAHEFSPEWILWLDADEVVEPSDAQALRRFVARGAERCVSYALEVLRMIGDLKHYDKRALWVNRLYAYDPCHTLAGGRLHFDLVPAEIVTSKRTSLRILHRASLTREHRERRFAKYQECDPSNAFQPSYENLRDPPRNVRTVEPRESSAPIVLD
jgi:glycosyltransferase involved in cell wall biosynthesis